ncbi:MAG: hypothetical protein AMK72_14850 [Planctomycetes bacterium SM23_25]|nr:MAG: hypothetical protein AMK72_14850 [Planctomycetes bacterium SM23_25]
MLAIGTAGAAKRRTPPKPAAGGETLLEDALAGPMAGVEHIVFAARQRGKDGHWYANFGYFAESDQRLAYGDGGKLYRLNLKTGGLACLLDDPKGGVRDPQVHYDGKKILFSYRKGGTANYHLYEIGADGSGLRQLTDGAHDDIEPTYLPDGDILFVSGRCNRWVNCWLTKVAVLYRCGADGSDIRMISSNNEHDNTPWPLPDGTILYTRWEYVDRSQVHYHHLWLVNPDGTGQMVYYGNQHGGITMIDAKPIPGTPRIVASFSPGHGRNEHDGVVTIVDPGSGGLDPGCQGAGTGPDERPRRHQDPVCARRGRPQGGPGVPRAAPPHAAPARTSHPAPRRTERGNRPPHARRRTGRPQHGRRQTRRNQTAARPGVAPEAHQLHGRHGTAELRRHVHPRTRPGHRAGRTGRVGVFRGAGPAEPDLRGP